ncbi:carbohydrate kinase family protein [Cohnella hongkongensis]|uniref:Carbohydrate kinase family protein n=1 Tax=Cohnella hongkongensis TaxID=178337 RepID=A0ABV9F9S7_9BACL
MSKRRSPAAEGEVVVAGHICLDMIPAIRGAEAPARSVGELLVPGKLIDVGAAALSTGGAVSNTGIALHRLGFPVTLMGKVGDDLIGGMILSILRDSGEMLAEGMIVAPGESSSYTIVINPPGVDRIFLHCTGANDTFSADDVPAEKLDGVRLFHYGYPPLMKRMYEEDGAELERLLALAKSRGPTVSLDLARPDPDSPAGRADWRTILRRALPYVDIFLPSFEEILYMLQPQRYRELSERRGSAELLAYADGPLLAELAEELLGMGTAVVAIKLGDRGLYVRTTGSAERLRAMGPGAPDESWQARELYAPCFRVEVEGTTGAGDCTIAGFLAGLLQGLTVEETVLAAVGTGAFNVERADAVSGIPDWDGLQRRIAAGWPQRETDLPLPGWSREPASGIWFREAGE